MASTDSDGASPTLPSKAQMTAGQSSNSLSRSVVITTRGGVRKLTPSACTGRIEPLPLTSVSVLTLNSGSGNSDHSGSAGPAAVSASSMRAPLANCVRAHEGHGSSASSAAGVDEGGTGMGSPVMGLSAQGLTPTTLTPPTVSAVMAHVATATMTIAGMPTSRAVLRSRYGLLEAVRKSTAAGIAPELAAGGGAAEPADDAQLSSTCAAPASAVDGSRMAVVGREALAPTKCPRARVLFRRPPHFNEPCCI